MTTSEKNWAKNVTYSTTHIVTPASVDELADIIRTTPKLRMLGTRHTFNDLADSDAVLVSLERMTNDDIELVGDQSSPTAVRVAGGVRYGDLVKKLDARGLALANLASLPHIGVGGSIQTGTHGSGDRISSLATQVTALELVTGTGELVRLERGDDDFNGAVVGLGALGAVVAVELEVEPAYEMTQSVYDGVRWSDVLDDFDQLSSIPDSVSLLTTWAEEDGNVQQVWIKHRSPQPPDLSTFGGTRAKEKRHTVLGDDPAPCTEQGTPGPWFERLPHFKLEFTPSSGEEVQTEYLMDRADVPAAMDVFRRFGPRIAPLMFVSEVRTMAGDDLWLSPAQGRSTVGIHVTWKPLEPEVRALLPELEAALPQSVRPHWGKVYEYSPEVITSRYERWDDFVALARKYDPERRFVNAHLERFGL